VNWKIGYQSRTSLPVSSRSGDPGSTRFSHAFVGAVILGCVVMSGLLLTVLVRTAASDSAEQLLWAQDWRLGYGIQPPLYTWLQLISFKIFGLNLAAIIFLKEILIGLTGWFTYLSVWRITDDRKLAVLAAASLFLMPQLAYESHRNLSHSLLTMALAAATLYLIVRLAREAKPVPWLHIWLGVVAGMGLLSKYNFGIFLFACGAAAISMPEIRRVVLNRWMLASLGLALLLFAPHVCWLGKHVQGELAGEMAVKMHPGANNSWGASVIRGTWKLTYLTAGMFVLPLFAVYGVSFWFWKKEKNPTPPAGDLWRRFIARLLGWEAAVLAIMIVGFKVTGFQGRWLLPLLLVVPPYFVLVFRERITPQMRRFVLAIALTSGIMAVLVLALGAELAGITGHYHGADVPFEELAAKIQADGFKEGSLVSNEHWIIGNLRLYFPGSVLATPVFQGPQTSGKEPVVVVWSDGAMPAGLKQYVQGRWPGVLEKNPVRIVQLNYRGSDKPAGKYHYVIAETGGK
jgi:lipopolysaccharide core galacturonosyltransferase RgtB